MTTLKKINLHSWIVADKTGKIIDSFEKQEEAIILHKRFPESKLMYRF